MIVNDAVVIVDDHNIEALRVELRSVAPDQGDALERGCTTWLAEDAEGFRSRLTIWPDGRRAALASTTGSCWGRWNADLQLIVLDNGDEVNVQGGVGEDA